MNLGHNNLGPDGAKALAEDLKIDKTLTSLNLSWSNIGPGGGQALLEVVQKNYAAVEISTENDALNQKLHELCSRNKAYKEETYKLWNKLKNSAILTE